MASFYFLKASLTAPNIQTALTAALHQMPVMVSSVTINALFPAGIL